MRPRIVIAPLVVTIFTASVAVAAPPRSTPELAPTAYPVGEVSVLFAEPASVTAPALAAMSVYAPTVMLPSPVASELAQSVTGAVEFVPVTEICVRAPLVPAVVVMPLSDFTRIPSPLVAEVVSEPTVTPSP